MPEADHCPQCGRPLTPGALAGLCPACLLKAGASADTITDAKPSSFNPPVISELAAKFPQLEILELIGKGGMGAVYKARQKQLDRIVALKILPPDIGSEAAFAERFTREARALAKLNHPNIVTLYEFGETSGQFYFLMEFVDGLNLRQLLNNSRIFPREALAIVPQICDALQFAHDHGIVHRDIKPENILLDRHGHVKVADFGLAKIVAIAAAACDRRAPESGTPQPSPATASENLTDAGKVMGTPKYMSPEQVTNPGEVDHRADIYALGVVFYQMLTGELPGKKIEPPSKKVQIDVRLDEIVLRALEKKPELRFQQASVLKTQVETIVETPPSAKIVPPLIQNPNQFLRWFAVTTLAMIVVIFLIAILGLIAAVGIPNFIKAREQSLARNQLAVKTTNPDEISPASVAPVVVETYPLSGAKDVPTGETEVRVRFSKPMTDGSWSWSTAWENSTPDFIGSPHYEADGKTCVVKVKLEPGRAYGFWLNSEQFQNFKDTDGHPAVPYLFSFQTKNQ